MNTRTQRHIHEDNEADLRAQIGFERETQERQRLTSHYTQDDMTEAQIKAWLSGWISRDVAASLENKGVTS